MGTRSKCLLLLSLSLLLASCGIFKTRTVTKIDSVYIDKTKVVTERVIDTLITIKSDTITYSFAQPARDTTINLSTKNGGKVTILYRGGRYYIKSIEREKAVPVKIYEKKVEYRNVYMNKKGKEVVAKGKSFNLDWLTFLIISIIVFILVLKSNLKNYVSSKIKLW
jgi:hypothetical protein